MRGKPRRKSVKPHDPRSPERNDPEPRKAPTRHPSSHFGKCDFEVMLSQAYPLVGIGSRRCARDPEVHCRRWIEHMRRGYLLSSLLKRPTEWSSEAFSSDLSQPQNRRNGAWCSIDNKLGLGRKTRIRARFSTAPREGLCGKELEIPFTFGHPVLRTSLTPSRRPPLE